MDEQNCECCEGTQPLTPRSNVNRPGLSSLSYRVGTHARFLETMKAHIAKMQVALTDPNNDAPTPVYPLSALTTRSADDPAIAMMDGWATVADVLTFYQERIANEGFLGTATERRSVLELARLIGYALRPGVAASVFLALDLDVGHNVLIQPNEVKAQTVPGPGELPQTFETAEILDARAEWNRLKPRSTKPQNITMDNVLSISSVYFQGAALNLKPGDRILFVFGDEIGEQVIRKVEIATPQFEKKWTEVVLQAVPFLVATGVLLLRLALATLESIASQYRAKMESQYLPRFNELVDSARNALQKPLENMLLGNYPPLNPDYFSHDRIYHFLGSLIGEEPPAMARAIDGISVFMKKQGLTTSEPAGAAAETDDIALIQFQNLLTAVEAAELDKALEILGGNTFAQEFACLASDILEQARPQGQLDKRFLIGFLETFVKNHKITKDNLDVISNLSKEYPSLDAQIERIKQILVQLVASAEVYDALTNLLNDLLILFVGEDSVRPLLEMLQELLRKVNRGPSNHCEPTLTSVSIDDLVAPLAKPPSLQLPSSAHLTRSTHNAFNANSDSVSQFVASITPSLGATLYQAWANARVNPSPPPLKSIYVLRAEAVPFGYNAPVKMVCIENPDDKTKGDIPCLTVPDGDWAPKDPGDERSDTLYLDTANTAVLPRSYILIYNQLTGSILAHVNDALTRPRTAYSVSSKTTQLTLSRDWWSPDSDSMKMIRDTVLALQSEELYLVDIPYAVDIQGTTIELDDLYDGLTSGRWLIISGERTDITGTSGVKATELVMIAEVDQFFDSALPGDSTRTIITLYNELAYHYQRNSVAIYGNVVKATHGETRKETLGSGDASQTFQTFALKQSPLTYTSSPTPTGAESTLQVYVNDVRWAESANLITLGSADRGFITKTDDGGKTSVIFGDGQNGARLPTAPGNVRAQYRYGIGRPGNVQAGQISLLMSKPLGVLSVNNPQRASGGADRESRDTARKNAPRTITALDRLVSVSDYADFARTFAGIGKSVAAHLSDCHRQLVHVTIAGQDDIPIDETSDLFHNLLLALRSYGDPDLPVTLQVRELFLLVISANLSISPDVQWDTVVKAVRAKLLDQFGFDKRELGQFVYLSEVISVIQSVQGVAYVDVDVLGGIPEKKADADAQKRPIRRLLTPSEIVSEVQAFLAKSKPNGLPTDRLSVNLADFEKGALRPAQLAYLSPDVPDTLILNQVK